MAHIRHHFVQTIAFVSLRMKPHLRTISTQLTESIIFVPPRGPFSGHKLRIRLCSNPSTINKALKTDEHLFQPAFICVSKYCVRPSKIRRLNSTQTGTEKKKITNTSTQIVEELPIVIFPVSFFSFITKAYIWSARKSSPRITTIFQIQFSFFSPPFFSPSFLHRIHFRIIHIFLSTTILVFSIFIFLTNFSILFPAHSYLTFTFFRLISVFSHPSPEGPFSLLLNLCFVVCQKFGCRSH